MDRLPELCRLCRAEQRGNLLGFKSDQVSSVIGKPGGLIALAEPCTRLLQPLIGGRSSTFESPLAASEEYANLVQV